VVIQTPGQARTSRLGVTVSSRVGNAVVRNRVKRLVRDIFRNRRLSLPAIVDVVVIASPDHWHHLHTMEALRKLRAA
jgi:ribonuclease P protein component